MKHKTIFGILIVISIVLLVGCQQSIVPEQKGTYKEAESFQPDEEIKANKFSSIDEFNDFVKRNTGSSVNYFGTRGGEVMMDIAMEESVQAVSAPVAKAAGASDVDDFEVSDYSETNIQVEGVDEADILKTDGNYIYTVSEKTLFIIKAYPGEDAEVISKIKFDNKPLSLFVNDNYLAVFGNYYNLDFFKEIDFIPRQGISYFNIYDISDRENPELVKEYKFEGNYFQARMIENYVYFVTTTMPEFRKYYPTPIIIDGTEKHSIPVQDIYYYNVPYRSAQFANVHAINLVNPSEITSKTITVEGSQNMYMSQNNIFITYTEYINEWELRKEIMVDLIMPKITSGDKEIIEKIKNTDDDVLSHYEKEDKIYQIIESYINFMDHEERDNFNDEVEVLLKKKLEEYEYMEYTLIHKINVDENIIRIAANGRVPGHVINQFSMDEYDNVFRIATTVNARWSTYAKERTESTNNIFTLDEDLDLLDELSGLAESEQIYSTRFIGNRLYMVTYRQVDPFFVIDLSNPNDIKELGQLKIPGFSRYLHPYDKDTIIGIGRDATETGRTRGLKISLFDVSDVENPEEIAKFVTDERYAQSTAEYEHKAFLFSKEKELLVIPVYSQDYRWDEESSESYNGAMVFKITKDEIELRGIVDHSMAKGKYYGPLVERSLYIEELLYTKSPTLMRINKIEDLEKVKNIELEQGSKYNIY